MDGRSTGNDELAGTPTIRSVETSHRLIETLEAIGPATVTEVATHADLSKGGVYKHLKTLRRAGFVVRDGTQYDLGLRFLDIGGRIRYKHPGAQLTKQRMRDLAEETDETSIYTVLENDRTTTLFRETGSKGVSTKTRVGKRLYPHETGAGKAILSQLPEERVESILRANGLPDVTKHTITDREAFLDELAEVRERGYAFNREESVDGLVAVAAPLVPDGTVLGACSVTGPYHRMKGKRLTDEIVETLLSTVNELSLNIAHADSV